MAILRIKLKGQDHLPYVTGEDSGFDLYRLHQAYTVVSPSRGDVPEQNIDLDEQSIIEFEFEDDTVWMGDSETIRTLFPKDVKRSADGDEFYLPDELESDQQDRGIFKKIGIKLVKVFVKKKIIKPKIREMATNLENKQLAFPGVEFQQVQFGVLAKCSPSIELSSLEFDPSGVAKIDVSSPYLLLLHGTASSTQNSFGDLKDSADWQNLFDGSSQSSKYKEGNLLAFQHRSLTASPLENMLGLVKSLPDNIELDLLSQSRGGLLAELLARFCTDPSGFDTVEDELLFKADRTRDREVIREIKENIAGRGIKVRSMVRVAGPANGTTLASNRLNIYLNVTFNLIGLAVGHVGNPIFVAFKEFIMEAVACKDDVDVLPGLESMNPKSPFIKVLNNQSSDIMINFPLLVVGGSSELSVSFKTLVVLLGKFFFRGKNDLVVDTESMKWGSRRNDDQVGVFIEQSGKIDHFKYFCTPPTLNAVVAGISADPGVIPAEFTLRSKAKERGVLGIEHGSYLQDTVSGNKPILILIPGIMGSNIGRKTNTPEGKNDLVWIDYLGFFKGKLEELALFPEPVSELTAHSLIKTSYRNLGERLAKTYDVVTFQFDWRKPLKETAAAFDLKIRDLLDKNQPIKIVAHSMGGVLVRDFGVYHGDTWQKLNKSAGFRGVFLGSPLGGSFRIPYVLFGKDSIIKLLGKIDIKHSTKELLGIFCNFPGILNLLPIDPEGQYDFSDIKLWEKMRTAYGDEDWPIPSKEILAEFGAHQQEIWKKNGAMDFSNFTYIAGQSGKKNFTVSNLAIEEGKLVFYATNQGDESVTWASGIPKSMRLGNQVYYANVTHGNLSKEKNLFTAIEELLIFGSTKRLQNSLPTSRGEQENFVPQEMEVFDISEENLVATLLGIHEQEDTWQDEKPINVQVTHGDLKYSKYPVLAGHFENDAILNAERAIDRHLNWELSRLHSLGLYPGAIGTSQIVLSGATSPSAFKGGIIVGLGPQGELSGYYLITSVEKGVSRYLTIKKEQEPEADSKQDFSLNGISVIAIANNFGGLSIESSIRAVLTGVQRANRNVYEVYKGSIRGIEEVEIIELYHDRALSILKSVQRLNSDSQKDFNVVFNANGLNYSLGKQRRIPVDNSLDWWTRITISVATRNSLQEDGGEMIRMAITTDGASEKVEYIPSSDQTLDILLRQMTAKNQFSPEIAKAMFELLVPFQFKDLIKQLNNINWVVDGASAAYPWEMLMDSVESDPLCVNMGMVRQLATSHSRMTMAKVPESTALIIGDPVLDGFMTQLPGARQEAEAVGAILRRQDYRAMSLINAKAPDIVMALFSRNHKIIHLAGHGVYRYGAKNSTGMVIGDNTFLTPGQIAGMSSSAELVFVNCCYLGQMDNSEELMSQQSNRFAANIGTQLINNGARVVIVAGWAVDDAAALEFSMEFYKYMFSGYGFGKAIKEARKTIFKKYKNNTWGAFQCYGDPFYKLTAGGSGATQDEDLCMEEIEIELENLLELMSANEFDFGYVSGRVEQVYSVAVKRSRSNSRILELVAGIYAGLMDYEKACSTYNKLFKSERAGYSVRAFEQYCNIRAKLAVKLYADNKLKIGEALEEIDKVIQELLDLSRLLGETGERISLLGSAHKRKLQLSLLAGEGDFEALDHAIAAYRSASERCNNSDPYPLCNWLILLQLKLWLEGKTYIGKAQKEAINSLHKIYENYSQNVKDSDDYWTMSNFAGMTLALFLLSKSPQKGDNITDAYLMLWKKAGHKGHKKAELEQLDVIETLLGKIPGEKSYTARSVILELKSALAEIG
ncbi:CHAT domain-containing protein [Algoriphagus sp. AGSA1]|uniref:CHAT domain-containing protein n=1 Tax=Algoriphagus sp. AGSA1 TaxID=2907213 RepID=UPI001F303305|nr:CHAT domain-containing protein [Algoriphagus sp. AGSA1]MCE7053763.1 CHAT domain-containing protein [Algoriphagus sp. AGSA1]